MIVFLNFVSGAHRLQFSEFDLLCLGVKYIVGGADLLKGMIMIVSDSTFSAVFCQPSELCLIFLVEGDFHNNLARVHFKYFGEC